MEFQGKRVLITGGSRGIGRAVAMAFARAGAQVALTYRDSKALAESALAELKGLAAGPHAAFRSDVSDPAEAENSVDQTVAKLGGLDIVVNNAGVYSLHDPTVVSYEAWQEAWTQHLATNLVGAANLSYCAARTMRESGGGRIIMMASRSAFRGAPDYPAYGASKAALSALGQSLAEALAPFGIFVGIVAPGYVETDLVREALAGPKGDAIRGESPLQRVARPEEVAHAVLFLASEGAEYTTGTIIDVNGASYLRS